jgi:hypothetical protein
VILDQTPVTSVAQIVDQIGSDHERDH